MYLMFLMGILRCGQECFADTTSLWWERTGRSPKKIHDHQQIAARASRVHLLYNVTALRLTEQNL